MFFLLLSGRVLLCTRTRFPGPWLLCTEVTVCAPRPSEPQPCPGPWPVRDVSRLLSARAQFLVGWFVFCEVVLGRFSLLHFPKFLLQPQAPCVVGHLSLSLRHTLVPPLLSRPPARGWLHISYSLPTVKAMCPGAVPAFPAPAPQPPSPGARPSPACSTLSSIHPPGGKSCRFFEWWLSVRGTCPPLASRTQLWLCESRLTVHSALSGPGSVLCPP